MTERPDDTSDMADTDTAPRALNAWPKTIADKVETLAARQAALRAETQRAQAGEALARARLGEALMGALQARCDAERAAREAALAHWKASAARFRRPARRNRLRRSAERALARLGARGLAAVIAGSGLWSGDRAAIAAYAARGADPTATPAALFDQAFYLSRNPDVAAAGGCPLAHYLLGGGAELRDPHPLFDARYYVERNGVQLGETGLTPLEHYLSFGAAEGFDPHPLFRTEVYLTQAPELFVTGEAPLAHFLREGAARGLSPHPLFQPDYYLSQAGEAARANPLAHFLAEGSAQGLRPHPLFDPAWFREAYPEFGAEEALTSLVRRPQTPLSPGPWMDGAAYRARRGEGFASGLDVLTDYLWGGAWAVGEPADGFYTAAYLAAHPELAAEGRTPLQHWARR